MMTDAGRSHHQEIQCATAASGAEFGPPHIHVYRVIYCLSLVTQMQTLSPPPVPFTVLNQYAPCMNAATLLQHSSIALEAVFLFDLAVKSAASCGMQKKLCSYQDPWALSVRRAL